MAYRFLQYLYIIFCLPLEVEVELPGVLTVVPEEGDWLCLGPVSDVRTVSSINKDLVVSVSPPCNTKYSLSKSDRLRTYPSPPCPSPQVDIVVLGVQCTLQFIPGGGEGGRGFAGQISVIDPGQPGEEDDTAVSEHFVKKHLTGPIVIAFFDGFQFTNLGETARETDVRLSKHVFTSFPTLWFLDWKSVEVYRISGRASLGKTKI